MLPSFSLTTPHCSAPREVRPRKAEVFRLVPGSVVLPTLRIQASCRRRLGMSRLLSRSGGSTEDSLFPATLVGGRPCWEWPSPARQPPLAPQSTPDREHWVSTRTSRPIRI